MKRKLISIFLALAISLGAWGARPAEVARAQGPVDFSADFTGFTGAGFTPTPGAGQLDSDTWIVTGMSYGSLVWGGSQTADDFARGTAINGVTTGGIYAFNVGGGNMILGVQPGGDDFTPGSIKLRIHNTTGFTLKFIDVSYKIWTRNDQDRSNSLNFSYSLDDVTYTPISALNYTTPAGADTPTSWSSTDRSATLTGLNIANNSYIYLQWSGDDAGGSGSRDEYGIDDVQISMNAINTDGDLSEWVDATERLGAINGRDIYMTWDDDNIYIATRGAGGAPTDHYTVAIDVDASDHGSANSGATANYQGASWPGDSDYGNKPDFLIDSFFDIFSEVTMRADGSGGWTTWTPTVSKTVRCADQTCAEWVFNKSELGIMDSTAIGVFIWFTNGSGNIYNSWPPENRQNNGTFYAYAYAKDTLSGRTPRSDVQRRGAEKQTFVSGSDNYFLNGWVRNFSVNSGGGSCPVIVSITANGQVTTNADDFKRMVSIQRGSGCPSATTTLQIFYEDGTANGAPTELGVGDAEGTLNVYEWGSWINLGANWRDTSSNWIERQNFSIPAEGSNGYYTLGSDTPTAITLANLTARGGAGWPWAVLAFTALLGGGAALWAVRRRHN